MNTSDRHASLHLIEQRHRLLAEYTHDVIWTMGLDGSITYVSPAVFSLRGLTPDEAMQQSVDQILKPDSQAKMLQFFMEVHQAIQLGEVPKSFKGEMEYYRKDGSTFWTEVLAFPLTDAKGTVIEILGVTRDINARKMYEDELKAAREEAEKASQIKSEFLAHISHEVRTPMTALLTYMTQAMNTTQGRDQTELLERAQSAGSLLLHLINDILDFSKIESGKLVLQQEAFVLNDVVQQVSDLVAHNIQTKGLAYTVNMAVDEHIALMGDAPRLTQALLNLVGNAVKFTDQGFVRVSISQVEQTDRQIKLLFEVQDSGPGISSDMCERVFERFVQAEPGNTSRNSGTGLGLPICRQLAQLMGGEAGVFSVPGQGSTFWFTVVVSLSSQPVIAVAARDVQFDSRLKGRRVLVVDDNDAIRDAMSRLLQHAGMVVNCAEDGQSALDLLAEQSYDLVLLDVQMPEMSGIELTQTLRRHQPPDLKIVGVSAGALGDDRQLCFQAGMNDHLLKPFNTQDLLSKILQHLTIG